MQNVMPMREHKTPQRTPRGESLHFRSYNTGADRTLSKIGGDTKLGGGRAQTQSLELFGVVYSIL